MPVDLTPVIILLILIVVPIALALKKDKKYVALIAVFFEGLLVCSFLLYVYIPGWVLMHKANREDPNAQYELGRWYVNNYIAYQLGADVDSSRYWVERAAKHKYPPALYSLGIMYKYGYFVPEPKGWTGPGGNVFPQPKKGQLVIDEAISLGFKPPVREDEFYWHVFRK